MWFCKLLDDYSLNSQMTCKPPELHTIMKKIAGTGLVLKVCETKNDAMCGKTIVFKIIQYRKRTKTNQNHIKLCEWE